ncbi:MAG: hypothetical protein R3B81_11730 [bacterium]
MTGPDRRKEPQNPRHDSPLEPTNDGKKDRKPNADPKKPVFRFARLDGRDTLKYEDTADK